MYPNTGLPQKSSILSDNVLDDKVATVWLISNILMRGFTKDQLKTFLQKQMNSLITKPASALITPQSVFTFFTQLMQIGFMHLTRTRLICMAAALPWHSSDV